MKLLLTSNGLCNKTIANALLDLLGKTFAKTNLAFIPTAANVEEGDKRWLIDDLSNCKKLGFASIDIVDISALPKNLWLPRLKLADVLLFGGGNTFHLMYWLEKSGLAKILPSMLKTRVYVGISAGSMIAGQAISLSQSKKLYYPELKSLYQNEHGLELVNFHIRPHLNSKLFPNIRKETLEKLAKEIKGTIYAIDDQTVIKVDGKKVEIVGEGKHLVFNKGLIHGRI